MDHDPEFTDEPEPKPPLTNVQRLARRCEQFWWVAPALALLLWAVSPLVKWWLDQPRVSHAIVGGRYVTSVSAPIIRRGKPSTPAERAARARVYNRLKAEQDQLHATPTANGPVAQRGPAPDPPKIDDSAVIRSIGASPTQTQQTRPRFTAEDARKMAETGALREAVIDPVLAVYLEMIKREAVNGLSRYESRIFTLPQYTDPVAEALKARGFDVRSLPGGGLDIRW